MATGTLELELNYPGGNRIHLNEANLRKRIRGMVRSAAVEEKKALEVMMARQNPNTGGNVA